MKQNSSPQTELLTFMNPTDAKDIACSLTNVFFTAVLSSEAPITNSDKDDLYVVHKLITLADKISKE